MLEPCGELCRATWAHLLATRRFLAGGIVVKHQFSRSLEDTSVLRNAYLAVVVSPVVDAENLNFYIVFRI